MKGVSVTDFRLGPRKKANANAMSFGYCDLASEADFTKLLAEDGTMYLGRKIRIDQATPHAKKPSRGMNQRKSPYFGSKSLRPPHRRDLRRTNSAPIPRSKQYHKSGHSERSNSRANRFLMNRGKSGSRNYNKRSPKNRRRPSRETATNGHNPTNPHNRFTNESGGRSRFARRS